MARKLDPYVTSVLNESYGQRLRKPIKALRLPCSDSHKWKEPAVVQIFEPRDQKVTCHICGKAHYLIFSKIQDNIKWAK